MPERQDAEEVEAVGAAPAAIVAAPVSEPGTGPPLHRHLLRLQQTVGNRGTVRAIRTLQREPVSTGYDWPTDNETVDSPFPLRVLIGWLHPHPVTELDPERYERAYDRNQVEPDPLGCMWKGQVTTANAVTDAFMRESSGHGYNFRRADVLGVIRDQIAQRKRDRVADIAFVPVGAWGKPSDDPHDSWFPWAEYSDDADQFDITPPDPLKGPGGPIVDWLEWYDFDAPWPESKDSDACVIHAQGETTGRVYGVVRLYMNDAIRAGYLGVDRDKVTKHIRDDLEERKVAKREHPDQRITHLDDRFHYRRQPKSASSATTTSLPAPPKKVQAQGDDDWQQTVGPQWTWTAGKAKPDRTVNVTLQKGLVVLQASVNLDTRAYTWVGGFQPQVSTPEYHFLGGLISGQLFVQIMAGLTMSSPASGTFTVQAAVGAQLTMKWGPITMQLQAGPQAAWDPVNGWQGQFATSPAAGPSDASSAATFGPGVSSPLPPPVTIGIRGTF